MPPEQNQDADIAAFEQLLRGLLGELSSRVSRRRRYRGRLWMHQYILDKNNRPVPVVNPIKWAYWMESNAHRVVVGQTTLPNGVWVSTCFLGLEHNHTGSRLHVFETMLKLRRNDRSYLPHQWRYSTWERAEAGHRALCRLYSAPQVDAGENAAALDYPMHVVNPRMLIRSDYATRFEDRTWQHAAARIGAETEGDAGAGEARQINYTDVETDANRFN